MRPCQEGYRCPYGDRQPDKMFCSLPRCAIIVLNGKADGMVYDALQKKTTVWHDKEKAK